jgi:hypothetical protein
MHMLVLRINSTHSRTHGAKGGHQTVTHSCPEAGCNMAQAEQLLHIRACECTIRLTSSKGAVGLMLQHGKMHGAMRKQTVCHPTQLQSAASWYI